MARICKSCKTPVPDGNLFCTNCGQKIDLSAPAEAPAPT